MSLIISIISIIGPLVLSTYLSILKLPIKTKIIVWIFCVFVSIASTIKAIQEWKKEKIKKEEEKIDDYYQMKVEISELLGRGLPSRYINGLGVHPEFKHYLDNAMKFEKNHKFKDAIEEYKKCLRNPRATPDKKAAAITLMGNCYFNLDNLDNAKICYKRASKLSKSIKDKAQRQHAKSIALCNLGLTYRYLKKAITFFDRAIKLQPDFAEAWDKKGMTLSMLGRHEEALEAYNMVTWLRPCFIDAWNNKGVELIRFGDSEEALKAFDKAIELKPDYATAWDNKGYILSKLGHYREAYEAHERAIKIKPDFANAYYNMAFLHFQKGDKENAIKNLVKSIELDKEFKNKAKKDEDFKKLHGDAEFKKITR